MENIIHLLHLMFITPSKKNVIQNRINNRNNEIKIKKELFLEYVNDNYLNCASNNILSENAINFIILEYFNKNNNQQNIIDITNSLKDNFYNLNFYSNEIYKIFNETIKICNMIKIPITDPIILYNMVINAFDYYNRTILYNNTLKGLTILNII